MSRDWVGVCDDAWFLVFERLDLFQLDSISRAHRKLGDLVGAYLYPAYRKKCREILANIDRHGRGKDPIHISFRGESAESPILPGVNLMRYISGFVPIGALIFYVPDFIKHRCDSLGNWVEDLFRNLTQTVVEWYTVPLIRSAIGVWGGGGAGFHEAIRFGNGRSDSEVLELVRFVHSEGIVPILRLHQSSLIGTDSISRLVAALVNCGRLKVLQTFTTAAPTQYVKPRFLLGLAICSEQLSMIKYVGPIPTGFDDVMLALEVSDEMTEYVLSMRAPIPKEEPEGDDAPMTIDEEVDASNDRALASMVYGRLFHGADMVVLNRAFRFLPSTPEDLLSIVYQGWRILDDQDLILKWLTDRGVLTQDTVDIILRPLIRRSLSRGHHQDDDPAECVCVGHELGRKLINRGFSGIPTAPVFRDRPQIRGRRIAAGRLEEPDT